MSAKRVNKLVYFDVLRIDAYLADKVLPTFDTLYRDFTLIQAANRLPLLLHFFVGAFNEGRDQQDCLPCRWAVLGFLGEKLVNEALQLAGKALRQWFRFLVDYVVS